LGYYSRASSHMIGNKSILSILNSVFSMFLETLTDDFMLYTEGVCVSNVASSLSLSFALCIPKILFNLLSVRLSLNL